MSEGPNGRALPKVQTVELPTLIAHANLGEAAQAAVASSASGPTALAALEAGGFLVEALRLFAHMLPQRESVWWACMCARHTAPADLSQPDRAALEAAEVWVRRQTDETRRAAMERAQQAGFQTPETWAAVGAFWSGDSMAPLNVPKVPPAPHFTGSAVAGSVQLAAVRGDPKRQPARIAAFLQSARDIAAGGAGRLEPEKP